MLREIALPATGKSQVQIASLSGISRQTLYDVLAESQAVTPALALRFGKLFGDGPEIWLRLQLAHDLWKARTDLAEAIEAIPTLGVA